MFCLLTWLFGFLHGIDNCSYTIQIRLAGHYRDRIGSWRRQSAFAFEKGRLAGSIVRPRLSRDRVESISRASRGSHPFRLQKYCFFSIPAKSLLVLLYHTATHLVSPSTKKHTKLVLPSTFYPSLDVWLPLLNYANKNVKLVQKMHFFCI